MIVFETVAIALVLFVSQTVANMCSGRQNGDQLPNSEDCSSFYVCNFGESKLFHCPTDLLYDQSKRACNWAYMVTCGKEPSEYTTEQPITFSAYTTDISEHEITLPTLPESPNTPITPNTPSLPYNETDIVFPGLAEIRPNVFHCINPKFYFAPHPRNCEKYFICENYRIHHHECGEGVYWDYIYNRCNFPLSASCFSGKPPNAFGKLSCTSGGHTFEYRESECKFLTGPPSIEPVDLIECPETQAFIAYPDDCRKYYICIEGMPIASSCPDKTAWDKDLSQCNAESWTECFD